MLLHRVQQQQQPLYTWTRVPLASAALGIADALTILSL